MNIMGNKVLLRAIEESDLELLREMINDPDIERLTGGKSFPVSKLQQQKWYESSQSNPNSFFLTIENEEKKAIGLVSVTGIDWKNRSASYGMKLTLSSEHGKGLGTDATMATMRYCFEELQLERLESVMLEYNKASERMCIDKCNWKREGLKKKAAYYKGEFHNLVVLAVLKEDYHELLKSNNYWNE
ncbi:GNAT family protein [Anoxynatronum sibiricum]|uniref:GNAT family protein n=1 Tax=Anoxynatronum sibiricum TaxID=210623 RepID=A0ABU9W0Z0_9CLOT